MNPNILFQYGNICITASIPLRRWGGQTLDLHGFRFKAAKNAIIKLARMAMVNQEPEIFLIHGYKHGSALRRYIRTGELRSDLLEAIPDLKNIKIQSCTKGATYVRFEWKGQLSIEYQRGDNIDN